MTEYWCKKCLKMIIKDIEEYIKKHPDENWIQCCYCGFNTSIEKIKKELY